MVLQEELKSYPFGDVWNRFCRENGVPEQGSWYREVRKYEETVLSKRI